MDDGAKATLEEINRKLGNIERDMAKRVDLDNLEQRQRDLLNAHYQRLSNMYFLLRQELDLPNATPAGLLGGSVDPLTDLETRVDNVEQKLHRLETRQTPTPVQSAPPSP